MGSDEWVILLFYIYYFVLLLFAHWRISLFFFFFDSSFLFFISYTNIYYCRWCWYSSPYVPRTFSNGLFQVQVVNTKPPISTGIHSMQIFGHASLSQSRNFFLIPDRFSRRPSQAGFYCGRSTILSWFGSRTVTLCTAIFIGNIHCWL